MCVTCHVCRSLRVPSRSLRFLFSPPTSLVLNPYTSYLVDNHATCCKPGTRTFPNFDTHPDHQAILKALEAAARIGNTLSRCHINNWHSSSTMKMGPLNNKQGQQAQQHEGSGQPRSDLEKVMRQFAQENRKLSENTKRFEMNGSH